MAIENLIEELEKLNVLELVQLKKTLEERWGVTAAAPMMAGFAPSAGPAEPAAPVEEQTEFTAMLTEVGPNKVPVIKVVREVTGLGLKEAKAVVDEAPQPVKEGITKEEAESIKAKFAEVGATIQVK